MDEIVLNPTVDLNVFKFPEETSSEVEKN